MQDSPEIGTNMSTDDYPSCSLLSYQFEFMEEMVHFAADINRKLEVFCFSGFSFAATTIAMEMPNVLMQVLKFDDNSSRNDKNINLARCPN